jgi:formylglycine-generating enzyme required for sulfatase activity
VETALTPRREAEERERQVREGEQQRHVQEAAIVRYRAEGRIKVDAKVIHGPPDGWFKPGEGRTEWFKDLDVGPEMVVVPAGEFTMGSNDYDSEKPPHKVSIKAPLAVGRFAVTFAEWDAAGLEHEPGDEGWGRGRRPVINVSCRHATAYVRWLSQRTGKAYRLLSEAEWEYACRAGTTTRYAFGDSITHQQAQFAERELGGAEQTAEVGTFAPNAWGLYDMHGNVWEWCQDNWHENYQGAPQDGSVWAGGNVSLRVLRGGSDYVDYLRSAYRFWSVPAYRDSGIGFRVARML